MAAPSGRRSRRNVSEPVPAVPDLSHANYVHVIIKPLTLGLLDLSCLVKLVETVAVPGLLRKKILTLGVLVLGLAAAASYVDFTAAHNAFFALFGVTGVHFAFALIRRQQLQPAAAYWLLCSGLLADLFAVNRWLQILNYLLIAYLTNLLNLIPASLTIHYVFCKYLADFNLDIFPVSTRLALSLGCAFFGLLTAKYVEALFKPQIENYIGNDGKILAVRRRRTSNTIVQRDGLSKNLRRTSLPVLTSHQRVHGVLSSSSTVDVALLSEAHGLVTDMLADPSLPPHVLTGLRALATLLSPPNHAGPGGHGRSRAGGASVAVSLADFNSGSDTEEIPYTGERPSALPKRLRRNLPPSLLRRMSTSTWTTTTSATGMPTLEPEPVRKRSTSFRHSSEGGTERPHVTSGNASVSPGGTPVLPGTPGSNTGTNRTPSPNHIPANSNAINNNNINNNNNNNHHYHYQSNCYNVNEHSNNKERRSYSTTAIPSGAVHRKSSRERKTVCSLHPLTSSDVEALHVMHEKAQRAKNGNEHSNNALVQSALHTEDGDGGEGDAETTEDESRDGDPLHPLPAAPPPPLTSIRRLNITSDYESSNDSPSGSDNNEAGTTGAEDPSTIGRPHRVTASGPKSMGVQTVGGRSGPLTGEMIAGTRCSLCGARTRSSNGCAVSSAKETSGGVALISDSETIAEDVEPKRPDESDAYRDIYNQGEVIASSIIAYEGPGFMVDGLHYNPETLAVDPLLNRINDWDYPIFDLSSGSGDRILSQMCYRVFREVGLFESFKIPLQEFLNYFHALETGYREKPYHNRMHAADVLHGVYYLTSQPIPGFTQMPTDSTDSPLHKTMTDDDCCGACSSLNSQRRCRFIAEESYGIMGANFPALELMALFTAAAMHDYDHPGRTNAFLVSTYAPQAVLYNDRSVLENHHAAAAWSLFLSRPEFNWLCHLDKAEFKRFRFLVIECILATDLKRHFEILAEFNAKANDDDAPGVDWLCEADRMLLMQMCIKLADINGPCKRHDIHVQWTYRIAEEFYEQGDEEAALGLPISPFMDRRYPQLAKLQESFINHLVAPLCNAYGESGLLPGHWIDSPESDDEVLPDTDKSAPTSDAKDTDDELLENEAEPPSADVTKLRRPSRQLKPRKVLCLQTAHLQENYEHWIGILKEENKAKNSPGDVVEEVSDDACKVSTEEDEADDDDQILIEEGSDHGEMETIHEEDASSTKSTPIKDSC